MKKKILLAILLIIFLLSLSITMVLYKNYKETDSAKTKQYLKEVEKVLKLNDNENVIKILKTNQTDYIILFGKNNINNKNNKLAAFNPDVETYSNVGLEYVNLQTNVIKRFETTKSFNGNPILQIYEDIENKYIIVSDNSTGNVIFNTINDGEFVDIIKNSFENDFNGYSFKATWDSEIAGKLKIKLDNYDRPYLKDNNEEYVLDFVNTAVNKDVYRQSYMANKFSNIKLLDIDDDKKLELVCTQNILYLNIAQSLPKNAGSIILTFKVNDKKIIYNSIEIKV